MQTAAAIESPTALDDTYTTEEIECLLLSLLEGEAFWLRLKLFAERAISKCKRKFWAVPDSRNPAPSDVYGAFIDLVLAGRRKCPRSMTLDDFAKYSMYWVALDLYLPRKSRARSMLDVETGRPQPLREEEWVPETEVDKSTLRSVEEEVECRLLIEKLYIELAPHPNAQKLLRAKLKDLTGRDVEVATGLTKLEVEAAEKHIASRLRGYRFRKD